LYYLYLDESGASRDIHELIVNSNEITCKFFTIGGIIVDSEGKVEFKKGYDTIMRTFFDFELTSDFKLHYDELRNAHLRPYESVYKRFDRPTKRKIADCVFDVIKNVDCRLLSITINLENHYGKYTYPITPISYGLYLILERFQYYLEENGEKGRAIYEQYNDPLKHKVNQTHRELDENHNFPKFTNFDNLIDICNGDPYSEHMLAFADFFAYAPWLKCDSCCTRVRRYEEIKHKYYNLDHYNSRRKGNYEI
jgi:hypothetical protein